MQRLFLCCKTKQNRWYIELLFQLVCFLLIFDAKFKADFVLTCFDGPSILLVEVGKLDFSIALCGMDPAFFYYHHLEPLHCR